MADDTRARGVPRRTAVAGAVVIAGAAAGCARYAEPSAETPATSGAAEGTVLGAASEVPVGGGKIFTDKKVVVTQPAKGEFKGFSAICTHQGCVVDKIADGTINCPCHGSKFGLADGSVKAGPAPKPLPATEVSVNADGKITMGGDKGVAPGEKPPDKKPPEKKPPAEKPVKGLAATKEIPVGGGKVFEKEQLVITQPTKGEFKGFSAICTHQGCTVNQVKGGTIDCPCHGSKFEVTDGSVRSGPAKKPLPYRSVKVDGDQIRLA
jgi:Rieske Fe-S protein